jgi:hypothetical protein
MTKHIHLKGNSRQRRSQLRELIRGLKPNEELIEDQPTQLRIITND